MIREDMLRPRIKDTLIREFRFLVKDGQGLSHSQEAHIMSAVNSTVNDVLSSATESTLDN